MSQKSTPELNTSALSQNVQQKQDSKHAQFSFLRKPLRANAMVVLIVLGVMIVSFQNFTDITHIPLQKLTPNFAVARMLATADSHRNERESDIRKWAPTRPTNEFVPKQALVVPNGGSDLNSVTTNWLERQSHLLIDGADQRLLDSMNRKMQTFFSSKSDSRKSGANKSEGATTEALKNSQERKEEIANHNSSEQSATIRFSTLTRVEMDIFQKTNLSCAYDGGGLQWNLSRPITQKVDINLRHKANDNSSTFHFNYNW